jgi:hypothetical protein
MGRADARARAAGAPLPAAVHQPRQGDAIGRARRPGPDPLAGDQDLRGGTLAFAFSDARWRLLDIPTKFRAWCDAVGPSRPDGLALRLFQAALNLSEERKGALFVLLRDPDASMPQLIAPPDRIVEDIVADDPTTPTTSRPAWPSARCTTSSGAGASWTSMPRSSKPWPGSTAPS